MALILARRRHETVIVRHKGDTLRVTYVRQHGHQALLGFEGSKESTSMALILARRRHETVIIRHKGEKLRVSYYGQNGHQALLAFDAPASFEINREELDQAKRLQVEEK